MMYFKYFFSMTGNASTAQTDQTDTSLESVYLNTQDSSAEGSCKTCLLSSNLPTFRSFCFFFLLFLCPLFFSFFPSASRSFFYLSSIFPLLFISSLPSFPLCFLSLLCSSDKWRFMRMTFYWFIQLENDIQAILNVICLFVCCNAFLYILLKQIRRQISFLFTNLRGCSTWWRDMLESC